MTKKTTPKRYDGKSAERRTRSTAEGGAKVNDKSLSAQIVHGIERIPAGIVALARSWQGLVILFVIATQLVLPVHYYTVRKDPHDERFAWRMYSPMRMTRCVPAFTVDGKPVNLPDEFHEAWIEIAKRGRFNVIEKMGAQLCAKHPGTAVHVVVECKYVGEREQTTWGGYDLCKVPEL